MKLCDEHEHACFGFQQETSRYNGDASIRLPGGAHLVDLGLKDKVILITGGAKASALPSRGPLQKKVQFP
jgi:hypothetical protein